MPAKDPTALPTSNSSRFSGLLGLPAVLLVLIMAGLLAWHSLTDLDIWFHLRAGNDLLAGGGFPRVNTYSFTNTQYPWLNHEWLFQILTVWTAPAEPLVADNAAGWNGLRLVLIMALTSILALGDGNLKRLRSNLIPVGVALTSLTVAVGLLLIWPRFNLRPELLSYCFLVLLIRWTEEHYRRPMPATIWRDGSLWRLFGLVLIWAQCHGFAALGPVVLFLQVATRPFDQQHGQTATRANTWTAPALWTPVLLGILALVLTPNLWRGLLFPLRALSQLSSDTADLSQTVSELVPLLETANSLSLTLWTFKISVVWGVIFSILGWRQISPLRQVLFIATILAAVANQRNIALYGLSFVLLHTGNQGLWPTLWWRRTLGTTRVPTIPPLGQTVGLTLIVASLVAWWGPKVVSDEFYLSEGVGRRFGNGSTPAVYPRSAVAALPNQQGQRTFANLGAAAFVLGTSEARLYIDGRTEAYPKAQWADYLQLRQAGPTALTMLDKERVSAVVLALGSGAFSELAANLVASPRWSVSAAGGGGVLFLNRTDDSPSPNPGVLDGAARDLLTTSESHPTRRADLCLAAAKLYQLAGSTDQAQRALQAGLDASPNHPTVNHNLGNLLMAEGNFSAALPLFQKAVQVNRRLAGSALNAGVCQLRMQQPEPAIASFRRSLAIDNSQVGGWVNLAVALRGTGRHQEAISALEKALTLRPGDTRLQGQLRQWLQNNR